RPAAGGADPAVRAPLRNGGRVRPDEPRGAGRGGAGGVVPPVPDGPCGAGRERQHADGVAEPRLRQGRGQGRGAGGGGGGGRAGGGGGGEEGEGGGERRVRQGRGQRRGAGGGGGGVRAGVPGGGQGRLAAAPLRAAGLRPRWRAAFVRARLGSVAFRGA